MRKILFAITLTLFFAIDLPVQGQEVSSYKIAITEIMYNPPETGTDSLEFLELYNYGTQIINLEGFVFTDGISHNFKEQLFYPGEYILLALDSGAVNRTFGVHSIRWSSGRLSNSGEALKLIDPFGLRVDSVYYSAYLPWPEKPNGLGASLTLCNPYLDHLIPESWSSCVDFVRVNSAGDSIWANPGIGCQWDAPPVANFFSSKNQLLLGNSVDFFDASLGEVTQWNWLFDGATPSSSTDSNPTGVTYSSYGTFRVCLTVTNDLGQDQHCEEGYITVAPPPAPVPLSITEIMYNPPESSDTLEYLELYYSGIDSLNLLNYKFVSGITHAFLATYIHSGEYLVLAGNKTAFKNVFGFEPIQWNSGSLSNNGELIKLISSDQRVVDSLYYSPFSPWPEGANGTGASFVLCNPELDNNLGENWAVSTDTSAVFGGVTLKGSPGRPCTPERPNALFTTNLTEILTGDSVKFTDLSSGGISSRLWSFPGGSPESSSMAEVFVTYSAPGSYPVCLRVSNNVGSDSLCVEGYISVGQPGERKLVITEIMYNSPDSGTDSLEYIELLNHGSINVNLKGYSFTSGINYTFADTSLAPGEYLVVAKDSSVIRSFYGVKSLQWTNSDLSNGGELILLNDASGRLIDSVYYDDLLPWPTQADGKGPSLVLCDADLDNGVYSNWSSAYDTVGQLSDGDYVMGNPGSGCRLDLVTPNFMTVDTFLFAGNAADFIDLTPNNPYQWHWEFEGGIPSESFNKDPGYILYSKPGQYKVCLEVKGQYGSGKVCKNRYVKVFKKGSLRLALTEIMYNPPENGEDMLEYLEFTNIDTVRINLKGFNLDGGLRYSFAPRSLDPGERIVIAKSALNFYNSFGYTVDQWNSTESLSNIGELIKLLDPMGGVVDSVKYLAKAPWPILPNGDGSSLVLCNPSSDNSKYENWQACTVYYGLSYNGDSLFANPGTGCTLTAPEFVVVPSKNKVQPGDSVQYHVVWLSPDVGYNLIWHFEGGAPESSSIETPMVKYPVEGIFGLELTAENQYGSSKRYFKDLITVQKGIGIETVNKKSLFSLAPNPTHNFVTINSTKEVEWVVISDLIGRVLEKRAERGTLLDLNMTGYSSGSYLLTLIFKDKSSSSQLLIVN